MARERRKGPSSRRTDHPRDSLWETRYREWTFQIPSTSGGWGRITGRGHVEVLLCLRGTGCGQDLSGEREGPLEVDTEGRAKEKWPEEKICLPTSV